MDHIGMRVVEDCKYCRLSTHTIVLCLFLSSWKATFSLEKKICLRCRNDVCASRMSLGECNLEFTGNERREKKKQLQFLPQHVHEVRRQTEFFMQVVH